MFQHHSVFVFDRLKRIFFSKQFFQPFRCVFWSMTSADVTVNSAQSMKNWQNSFCVRFLKKYYYYYSYFVVVITRICCVIRKIKFIIKIDWQLFECEGRIKFLIKATKRGCRSIRRTHELKDCLQDIVRIVIEVYKVIEHNVHKFTNKLWYCLWNNVLMLKRYS